MYKIVIPSYRRQDILKVRTLQMLKSYSIPDEQVNIYCATEEELKTYQDTITGNYRWEVIGQAGIANARNYITENNPDNEWLLWIDDDIEAIIKLEGKELNRIPDLHSLVTEMIDTAEGIGSGQVGIYPVTNHYFMKNKIATDLKFIIGCFCLTKNDPECEPRHFNLIEDFERTLKYYVKYNVSCRYENIAVKTNYMLAKGGIHSTGMRTNINKEKEVDKYVDVFSDWCVKKQKSGNIVDVRFRKTGEIVFNYKKWLDQVNSQI
tara:strand:+ start:670 stop:1461 length:792 start_codon:yes stop_codon:yes gene_type:complete